MTKKEFIFCILAAIFAALFALQTVKVKIIEVPKTDTIYAKQPYKIDTLKIKSPPEKVIIYKHDTLIRKVVERDTLILSIRKRANRLEVDRISTNGMIQTETHKLGFWNGYAINHKGNVRIKRHKVLKWCVGIAATSLIGFVTYKTLLSN
jgi:hypothetical protein